MDGWFSHRGEQQRLLTAGEVTLRRIMRSKTIRPKQARGMTREYLDLFEGADLPRVRNRALFSLNRALSVIPMKIKKILIRITNERLEFGDD